MEKASRMAGETKSLSDEQKERIAEEKRKAEAKIAEARIMLDEKIAKAESADAFAREIEEARENFLSEKARIEEKLEDIIETIRREG